MALRLHSTSNLLSWGQYYRVPTFPFMIKTKFSYFLFCMGSLINHLEAVKVEEALQTEQSQEKLLQVSVLILSLDFQDMHLKLMWNLFW